MSQLIGLVIALASIVATTMLHAGSFIPWQSPPAVDSTGNEHSMISVLYIPEWEPGMPRKNRQITIDSDGSGQISERRDDKLIYLATFTTQSDVFDHWQQASVDRLNALYMDQGLEDQGIIVEGNPESHKFFFLYPDKHRVIDTEPAYKGTPVELSRLAEQLAEMAREAQPAPPNALYFYTRPVGKQQSLSIIKRQGSLPTTAEVKETLNEELQLAIDRPTWLVAITPEQRSDIQKHLGRDSNSPYFYTRTPQDTVLKMGFIEMKN